MIKILEKLHNRKGMTLIEVTVSFAIVAIISVVIVIGFRTIGSVTQEGRNTSDISQQLEQQIAASSSSTVESDADLNISTGSRSTITINGEIKEYTIEENGTTRTFRLFEAKDIQN